MTVGAGSFVSPRFDIADDVEIGANAQLTGSGRIGSGVRIGHGVVIEGEVSIGAGSSIGHHVLLMGRVTMGEGNEIGHGTTIGGGPDNPDHLHSDGAIEIGSRNVFRELCTVNMPTTEALTRIGSDNYFMRGVHIAHDCLIGNHTKLAIGTTLGGHVEIGDYAYLGLSAAVHQRRHIGAHCMVGMTSAVVKHLPPFATLVGTKFTKINAVGLRRRGFSDAAIEAIETEYGFRPPQDIPQAEAAASLAEIRRFLSSHDPLVTYPRHSQ